MRKNSLLNLLIIVMMVFVVGCEDLLKNDVPDSIWDEDFVANPTPVISSINPADSTYGAVGARKLVTITGQNFSTTPENNFVVFGTDQAIIYNATATELQVIPPANFGDGLTIKVYTQLGEGIATYGSEANPHLFKVKDPISKPGNYSKYDNPGGICCDAAGNLYVTKGKIIDKITPDGIKQENYLEIRAKNTNNIKKGPDGAFYYTYGLYIMKTDTTGGDTYKKATFKTKDLDFDSYGNLYIVGENAIAFVDRITMESTNLAEFQDTTFTACRVYNNELYLAGNYSGSEEGISQGQFICKVGLNSDGTLNGDIQSIRNWDGTAYDGINITTISFNEDGKIYLATIGHSILGIEGDYATGMMEDVYNSIIGDKIAYRMTWGAGEDIYINTLDIDNQDNTTILKILLFEESAPYYGRVNNL